MEAIVAFLALVLADLPEIGPRDHWRFTFSATQAEYNWKLGCRHIQWVQKYWSHDIDWADDARWCCRCWDVLDDCRRIHPFNDEACVRKSKELRSLLTYREYYGSRMPPPIPIWHLKAKLWGEP